MIVSRLNFAMAGLLVGAAPLLAATAAPSPALKPAADKLLSGMKADGQTIQSHAAQMEMLAKDPNSTWSQFDQQWNEIKPAQEVLQRKLERLESMRASLSDSQRKTLDQDKLAVQQIAARTHQLYQRIDQSGADLKSPQFRMYVQSLARNAQSVASSSAGA